MSGHENFGYSPFPIWRTPPGEQTGVWWVQATMSEGWAYWRCARCGTAGNGQSVALQRLRHWFHSKRCRGAR